jgi:hypothetical protein
MLSIILYIARGYSVREDEVSRHLDEPDIRNVAYKKLAAETTLGQFPFEFSISSMLLHNKSRSPDIESNRASSNSKHIVGMKGMHTDETTEGRNKTCGRSEIAIKIFKRANRPAPQRGVRASAAFASTA